MTSGIAAEMNKPPRRAARTRTRGHVRYGMMMKAARSAGWWEALLIGGTFNSLAGRVVNVGIGRRDVATGTGCGQTCARPVDERWMTQHFLCVNRKFGG